MNPQYNLIQYSNDDYKITNKNDLLIKEFKSRKAAINWLNKNQIKNKKGKYEN
tara:strand:- start:116 stop:274 length:159 start_codon:yes stop_codon:yes gene_type:complete